MKIFFFDIDGTIAVKGKYKDSVKYALQRLKEKGYLTFICTGRPSFYVNNLFSDLVSGYICCNGRYIVYNNQTIFSLPLSFEELNYCKELIVKHHLGAMFVGEKYTYTFNTNLDQTNNILNMYDPSIVKPYNDEKEIYTFDLFYKEDPSYIDLVFKDKLVLNHHSNRGSCDCSTLNYNKASAILYLLNYFNLDKKDAYCFGDGSNDLCMFDVLDNTIAMGNAIMELKEKASYITDTVENDGVYKALLDLNFID